MLKIFVLFILSFSAFAVAAPLRVVAAENFYGRLAAQIGGPEMQVTSILNNPQQDPHLMSASPQTAKAVADADIIIYNGLGYDPWMKNLIANADPQKIIIAVGDLAGKTMGDNPHIWYNPNTMMRLADALTADLRQINPTQTAYYEAQRDAFKKQNKTLLEKIARMNRQFHGMPVIATEPIFNEMAALLGLEMKGRSFQIHIMNGVAPSAAEIQDFQDRLKNQAVKVLIYNNQVSDPITERMKVFAEKLGIPTVGVSETEPADQDYCTWMNRQLDALANALYPDNISTGSGRKLFR